MRIIWGPELQLGHRVIDSQHEELINLLNELNDAVAADHLILADVLRRLATYEGKPSPVPPPAAPVPVPATSPTTPAAKS